MSQGLDGVRKAARERKQERFTALLHHLSVGLLRDSFYALQRKASPGADGVTWQEYETGLEGRLIDLHSRVHRGGYRAKPLKPSLYSATGRPTGEQIRTAVRAVLQDKKYKENATRLQKEFARYNAFDLITETVNSMLSLKNSDTLLATVGARD